MEQLVKIKSLITLWTVRLSSGLYVLCNTSDRTSGLETVRPLRGIQGEPHFSPFVLLFFKSTPKTNKWLLRPPKSNGTSI